jgi:hypothetical protein
MVSLIVNTQDLISFTVPAYWMYFIALSTVRTLYYPSRADGIRARRRVKRMNDVETDAL